MLGSLKLKLSVAVLSQITQLSVTLAYNSSSMVDWHSQNDLSVSHRPKQSWSFGKRFPSIPHKGVKILSFLLRFVLHTGHWWAVNFIQIKSAQFSVSHTVGVWSQWWNHVQQRTKRVFNTQGWGVWNHIYIGSFILINWFCSRSKATNH